MREKEIVQSVEKKIALSLSHAFTDFTFLSLACITKLRYNYLAEDVASSRKAEAKVETN